MVVVIVVVVIREKSSCSSPVTSDVIHGSSCKVVDSESFNCCFLGFWASENGSFRKLGVPYFGVLIVRILLFRVLD